MKRGPIGVHARRAICSVALAGFALFAFSAPAHAAFPGKNGKIAFVRSEGPAFNAEIYTINVDGTGQTNVTNNPDRDSNPAWSPDGTKIAFDRGSNVVDDFDVYTMNANGSTVTQLTNDPAYDFGPAWSPDGTKIAFGSARDGDFEIYTMNADGSAVTRLTNSPGFDDFPAWSPDGTKIAFRASATTPIRGDLCDERRRHRADERHQQPGA